MAAACRTTAPLLCFLMDGKWEHCWNGGAEQSLCLANCSVCLLGIIRGCMVCAMGTFGLICSWWESTSAGGWGLGNSRFCLRWKRFPLETCSRDSPQQGPAPTPAPERFSCSSSWARAGHGEQPSSQGSSAPHAPAMCLQGSALRLQVPMAAWKPWKLAP